MNNALIWQAPDASQVADVVGRFCASPYVLIGLDFQRPPDDPELTELLYTDGKLPASFRPKWRLVERHPWYTFGAEGEGSGSVQPETRYVSLVQPLDDLSFRYFTLAFESGIDFAVFAEDLDFAEYKRISWNKRKNWVPDGEEIADDLESLLQASRLSVLPRLPDWDADHELMAISRSSRLLEDMKREVANRGTPTFASYEDFKAGLGSGSRREGAWAYLGDARQEIKRYP